jgi:hypothetical protein
MEQKDIGTMMLAFADEAVKMGRESFEMDLDFSEGSLQKVEQILSHLANEMPESAGETAVDEMSKVWGGYLGEVVRRRWGGEWTIDYYPGGQYLIITLNVAGSKLFPSMKVNRRLTEGPQENIWDFYKTVKARLEAKPGGRVQ